MRTLRHRVTAALAVGLLPALAGTAPATAAPAPTPAAVTIAPTCGPAIDPAAAAGARYAIRVDGVSFNPFNQVLVTFDAGRAGRPESFATTTDGFGRFGLTIQPAQRPAGTHVVRADDFRLREAMASFTVPCPPAVSPPTEKSIGQRFTPQLRLDPAIGRPGFVTQVTGTGFPPGQAVALSWDRGSVAVQPPGTAPDLVTADPGGGFRAPLLIFHHDVRGVRRLSAAPRGPVAYTAAPTVDFLVVPGTLQPDDLVVRR